MVYTKTGDKGETSLVGGTRVKKCDLRVEAYGTIDELNSHVGVVAEFAKSINASLYHLLKQIQDNLFVVQTLLATEDEALYQKMPQLPANATLQLEQAIDAMTQQLPKNNAFIIPGGSMAGAQCHVARTVCRRAERCMVRLHQESPIESQLCCYVNRLSDYLFVLSRILVLEEGRDEDYWSADK